MGKAVKPAACGLILSKAVEEGKLTEGVAKDLKDQIDALVKEHQTGDFKEQQAAAARLNGLLSEAEYQATLKQLVDLRNRLVDKSGWAFITSFKNPVDGVLAYIHGLRGLERNVQNSVDLLGETLTSQYRGRLYNELEAAGLKKAWISGAFEKEFYMEKAEVTKPKGEGQPGISKSAEALKMANIVNDIQKDFIGQLRRLGVDKRELSGYVIRRGWDMEKLRNGNGKFKPQDRDAAYAYWRDTMAPLWDEKRTFEGMGPDEREDFLRSAWEGLESGVHLKYDGDSRTAHGEELAVYTGTRNLAKAQSAHRKLHFKDGLSEWQAMREFGTGSVADIVDQSIGSSARTIALLDRFGTNPQDRLARWKKRISEQYRGDREIQKALKGGIESIDNAFSNIDGTSRIPMHEGVQSFTSNIINWTISSKLGGILVAQFGDIPVMAAAMRRLGAGFADSHLHATVGLLKGRGGEDVMRQARIAAGATDGWIAGMNRYVGLQDGVNQKGFTGIVHRRVQQFMSYTGLNWMNDTNRTTMHEWVRGQLGEMATTGKTLSDLQKDYPDAIRSFNRFGITEDDWRLLRHTLTKDDGVNRVSFVDLKKKIPEAEMRAAMQRLGMNDTKNNLARAYDNLSRTWGMFAMAQSRDAILTPGARIRSILLQGTRPGSYGGMLARFFALFKSFSADYAVNVVGAEVFDRVGGRGFKGFVQGAATLPGMVGLGQLIAAATVMGVVSNATRDVLNGKKPREINDWKTWGAGMLKSGALTLYGDYLFGEFNRYGRSGTSAFLGPILGQSDAFFSLMSKISHGDFPNAGDEGINLVKQNAPFVNFLYTKLLLDYSVMYWLQETVNPGYLQRAEANMKKRTGQEYVISPNQVANMPLDERLKAFTEVPGQLVNGAE